MASLSEIFSIVFIVSAGICVMFGAYVLRLMRSAHANRAFFATTLVLAIWAVGLGFALTATSEQVSVLWRRIAAVGWGTFFSLLLNFVLALTGRTPLLKKWWTYVLLYFPAAISLLVFAAPTSLNPAPFVMVSTPMGWVNVAEYNTWDILYMVYYLSYTAVSLFLLWRWGIKSADKKVKSQSRIVLVSFIAALVLGTMTDMFANSLLSFRIPQIAPVVMMIPVTAIYLTMYRYGLLSHKPLSSTEEILNPTARKRIYRYLTIALFVGALLNFLTQYVLNGEGVLLTTLLMSAVFVLIGVVIQVVNRLKISNRAKDFINVLCLSISIPVVTLRFIEYGSVTIWAFPFIFVIVALVFNKRTVLGIIAFVSILTQIIVWIVAPEVSVPIDRLDFISRIGIFLIGIGLAFYVNQVYISRLKQNADQVTLQMLVSDISTDFVTANQYNIEEKTDDLLAKAGAFFGADRAFACFKNAEGTMYHCGQIWVNGQVAEPEGTAHSFAAEDYAWWLSQIALKEVVHVTDSNKLPDGAAAEKAYMHRAHCRSMLSIPVVNQNSVLGFLNFEDVKSPRTWREEHISLLKILANTLADAMTKANAEKEILYMAYYDHLTGLPNRQLFKDRLSQAILQAGRNGRCISVMFLDLDSFKAVNDTLGHERGDELLCIISERLTSCVRGSDTVSRFGGDEFLLLINNLVRVSDIVKVAENIMKQFNRPFELKGQEFYITASAGIAMYPADGADADILIKNADIAMYSAKETGKNQYVMCSHQMKETVNLNVSLTTHLYRALSRNEFVVYYQPQVCLHTQKIIGLEALLRWKSAEYGMVTPGRFIPLAEQTGLINPIGEWALREACAQNAKWQVMGLPAVRMAVNLSVIQLRNPKLRNIVSDVLEETGMDPSYLELEITESAATKEADYIIDVLKRLKALGITLSIDDFGTEYSSLSRLKMLPVDRIKMDIQFVHGIDGNDKDKAITKVIINLAKTLGLKVIAEGVETESQLQFLSQKMCDEVQGFYYYRPMPADQVELALRKDMLRRMEEAKGF